MPEQFSLLSDDEEPKPYKLDRVSNPGAVTGYSLFFALFPSQEDARRITQLVETQREAHALRGKPFLPERLHLSLQAVADFTDAVPQTIVDAACMAAGRVLCPPLSVTYDRVALFPNAKAACVFKCDQSSGAQVVALRNQLGELLRKAHLRPTASPSPHMTMLYDDPNRAFDAPIEPFMWRATRFVLILSHLGASHHQWVGEWPLAGNITS